jgi:hypothetical protein
MEIDDSQQLRTQKIIKDDKILKRPNQPLKEFTKIKGRRFSCAYYSKYPWIEFSEDTNKIYCFICLNFRNRFDEVSSDPFYDGFNNWNKTDEKCKIHEESNAHKLARNRHKDKIIKLSTSKNNVNNQISKIVGKNREYLHTLFKALMYICYQNLAIRGHDQSENSTNKGNYLELIELLKGFMLIISEY